MYLISLSMYSKYISLNYWPIHKFKLSFLYTRSFIKKWTCDINDNLWSPGILKMVKYHVWYTFDTDILLIRLDTRIEIVSVKSLFLNKIIISDTRLIRLDTHIRKVSVKSLILNKKLYPILFLYVPILISENYRLNLYF
jgi:hypothetical protein